MHECICGKDGHPIRSTACPVHGTWRPIETAPEHTAVLTYTPNYDGGPFHIQAYRWVTEVEEEIESETRNAKGRRKIIQEVHTKRRDWTYTDLATHWMPLPEPPK